MKKRGQKKKIYLVIPSCPLWVSIVCLLEVISPFPVGAVSVCAVPESLQKSLQGSLQGTAGATCCECSADAESLWPTTGGCLTEWHIQCSANKVCAPFWTMGGRRNGASLTSCCCASSLLESHLLLLLTSGCIKTVQGKMRLR